MSGAGTRAASEALRLAAGLGDSLLGHRLSVLIFHRVLPQADPLFPDELTAARFDELMALLARNTQVLPLGQALALRAQRKLPPRAVAITFDDGYADNLTVAWPILQRHGLPATVFVASGFLDGGRMWNDTVIETLRASSREALDTAELGLGLGRLPLVTVADRRRAIDAVLKAVKHRPVDERLALVQSLHAAAGSPRLPDDLMLSTPQLQSLHRAGAEIGAHTVHHPILAVLPDAEAERELHEGRRALQQRIDAPVDLLAYPNGKPRQDYDLRHAAMARKLGFRAAVSTAPGPVTTSSDDFQLPRFTPWDRAPGRWLLRLLLLRWRLAPAEVAA